MKKKSRNETTDTEKKIPNAGSGGFNTGSESDPDFDKGTPISDEEKKTGKPPFPSTPDKGGKLRKAFQEGMKDDSPDN